MGVDKSRVISRVISNVPKCTQMYHFGPERPKWVLSENPDISAFLTCMCPEKVQDVRGFESPMLHHKKVRVFGLFLFAV